jgi:seryl-tRNA synthetase
MLDITLLRKDLDGVIARLQTRKNPQVFLNVVLKSCKRSATV